jgi:hypothetical protein
VTQSIHNRNLLGSELDFGTPYPDRLFVDVIYSNVLEANFKLLNLQNACLFSLLSVTSKCFEEVVLRRGTQQEVSVICASRHSAAM